MSYEEWFDRLHRLASKIGEEDALWIVGEVDLREKYFEKHKSPEDTLDAILKG